MNIAAKEIQEPQDRADQRRVAIFIDGSNLYHALEESCHRTDLDFAAFVRRIARGRPLFRTYYYNILQDEKRRPQEAHDQQRFFQSLSQIPYFEIRLGGVKFREGQMVEKGVDIMLATDLLHYGWQDFYDVAILVSGDGDFAYAIQTVKNMGKYAEVVVFESNQSPELIQIADERVVLTPDSLADLWLTSSEASQGTAASKRRRRRGGRRWGTTPPAPREDAPGPPPADPT
ncbi:MAG: NYN domain-containing protein [Chloroflexi bacterium]|nr:NYN domain-containing protein [Chloroflexota bacterium]